MYLIVPIISLFPSRRRQTPHGGIIRFQCSVLVTVLSVTLIHLSFFANPLPSREKSTSFSDIWTQLSLSLFIIFYHRRELSLSFSLHHNFLFLLIFQEKTINDEKSIFVSSRYLIFFHERFKKQHFLQLMRTMNIIISSLNHVILKK